MVIKNLLRRGFFTSFSLRALTSSFSPFLNSNSSSGVPYKLISITSSSYSYSSDTRKSLIPSSSKYSYRFIKEDPSQEQHIEQRLDSKEEDDESEDNWWEESELGIKPKMGDGGSGGGVVLNNLPWGDQALSIVLEALTPFGADLKLFALRASPRKAIFVRLDKLSNKYGCPSLEDLDTYSHEIKKRLDEAAEHGEVPESLGVLVSNPGADRLLKVPDDLDRFKDLPMRVCYVKVEESNTNPIKMTEVFTLESIEAEFCTWKLANVKENYGPLGKGRPLSRKMRDWRLKLPFEAHKTVSLYIP